MDAEKPFVLILGYNTSLLGCVLEVLLHSSLSGNIVILLDVDAAICWWFEVVFSLTADITVILLDVEGASCDATSISELNSFLSGKSFILLDVARFSGFLIGVSTCVSSLLSSEIIKKIMQLVILFRDKQINEIKIIS